MAFSHRVERDVGAPLAASFAWFTDFREDDTRLFDQPQERRVVVPLPDGRIRIEDRMYGSAAVRLVGEVTFSPPDRWAMDGQILYKSRQAGAFRSRYVLTERPGGGSHIAVRIEVEPTWWVARLFLVLRWRRVRRRIDHVYDAIAAAASAEAPLAGAA